jgi:hypothetical protein
MFYNPLRNYVYNGNLLQIKFKQRYKKGSIVPGKTGAIQETMQRYWLKR